MHLLYVSRKKLGVNVRRTNVSVLRTPLRSMDATGTLSSYFGTCSVTTSSNKIKNRNEAMKPFRAPETPHGPKADQMPTNGNLECSENPTLGTDIEQSVVEENEDDDNKGFFQHKYCCFWIIAFVLIMIFSRRLVGSVF